MAYASVSGHLPFESASKTGHIPVVQDALVQKILSHFKRSAPALSPDSHDALCWHTLRESSTLTSIVATDGSFQALGSAQDEAAFGITKAALITLPQFPSPHAAGTSIHPLALASFLQSHTLTQASVLPLRNVASDFGSNYSAVRNILYTAMREMHLMDTLQWIARRAWDTFPHPTPAFDCPYCRHLVDSSFPLGTDTMACPVCGETLFFTDLLGFHLDLQQDAAPESIVSMFMTFHEILLLFSAVKKLADAKDFAQLRTTLFLRDGPMTLPSQYGKLVPHLRDLFFYFRTRHNCIIHMAGIEKNGRFAQHFADISPQSSGNALSYAVPDHSYILKYIRQRPQTENAYGYRANWGEKVLFCLAQDCKLVVNMPIGTFAREDAHWPKSEDIPGLADTLFALARLRSYRYENALFPISLANDAASLSVYPSAKMLDAFIESNLLKGNVL